MCSGGIGVVFCRDLGCVPGGWGLCSAGIWGCVPGGLGLCSGGIGAVFCRDLGCVPGESEKRCSSSVVRKRPFSPSRGVGHKA